MSWADGDDPAAGDGHTARGVNIAVVVHGQDNGVGEKGVNGGHAVLLPPGMGLPETRL